MQEMVESLPLQRNNGGKGSLSKTERMGFNAVPRNGVTVHK